MLHTGPSAATELLWLCGRLLLGHTTLAVEPCAGGVVAERTGTDNTQDGQDWGYGVHLCRGPGQVGSLESTQS